MYQSKQARRTIPKQASPYSNRHLSPSQHNSTRARTYSVSVALPLIEDLSGRCCSLTYGKECSLEVHRDSSANHEVYFIAKSERIHSTFSARSKHRALLKRGSIRCSKSIVLSTERSTTREWNGSTERSSPNTTRECPLHYYATYQHSTMAGSELSCVT